MEKILKFLKIEAKKYNILNCIYFNPSLLKKDKDTIEKCKQNKCNNYNKNYMCPPLFSPPNLSKYDFGIILQYKCAKKRWREEKINFHKIILKIENSIIEKFPKIELYSFIGGSCELCSPCEATNKKKCNYPNKARPSLESAGFNVLKLLKELKLPYEFYNDIVIWTGAILLKEA